MARNTGWIPQQHGAWAMLVVPFACGVALRASDATLRPHLVALFAFWFVGYLAFNAASQWLKAPPRRRPKFRRPTLVYSAGAVVLGVATLALAGWSLLAWAPAFVPLLLPALWLASQRNERATLGGALTTGAAALMTLVARYDSPAELWTDATAPAVLWVTAAVFAYFFGTVLYVKTNIRERGSVAYQRASVGWHAAWTVIAAAMAAFGLAPWWWTPFFAAATLRAHLVPRIEPRLSPLRIGLIEIAFSTVLFLDVALLPH